MKYFLFLYSINYIHNEKIFRKRISMLNDSIWHFKIDYHTRNWKLPHTIRIEANTKQKSIDWITRREEKKMFILYLCRNEISKCWAIYNIKKLVEYGPVNLNKKLLTKKRYDYQYKNVKEKENDIFIDADCNVLSTNETIWCRLN